MHVCLHCFVSFITPTSSRASSASMFKCCFVQGCAACFPVKPVYDEQLCAVVMLSDHNVVMLSDHNVVMLSDHNAVMLSDRNVVMLSEH